MTRPELPDEADVVVIGGGIVGCSTAYFLAKSGFKVVLLEKGEISDEQSGRNWGWTRQHGRDPREIRLAMLSLSIWTEFAEELGRDFERIREGSLRLAYSDEDMARHEAWAQEVRDLDIESTVLSRTEVKELIPQLDGPFLGGTYTQSDGQAEPRTATVAIAEAAEELGATVVTHCAVEDISTQDGAVTQVTSEGGAIKTPIVVCAAGAWSYKVGRFVGLSLPQRAVTATVACTTPVPLFTHTIVGGAGVSFRQKRDGTLYIASTGSVYYDLDMEALSHLRLFLPNFRRARNEIHVRVGRELLRDILRRMPWSSARKHPFAHTVGVEPKPDQRTVAASLANLHELVPSLGEVGILRVWAGRIDVTPDAVPVIGTVPEVEGFIFATGFSGHGFALGPGVGFVVAKLIAGHETSVDLYPLRYSRFEEGDLADYTKTI